jgi:hypothetical protein
MVFAKLMAMEKHCKNYFNELFHNRTLKNNWFSTHPGGHVALFSMFSPSRRRERRSDVIEMLKSEYRIQDVVDYSGLEWDGLFLEGTGAMVLDHIERVAYTASSNRANDIELAGGSVRCMLAGIHLIRREIEPSPLDVADE